MYNTEEKTKMTQETGADLVFRLLLEKKKDLSVTDQTAHLHTSKDKADIRSVALLLTAAVIRSRKR